MLGHMYIVSTQTNDVIQAHIYVWDPSGTLVNLRMGEYRMKFGLVHRLIIPGLEFYSIERGLFHGPVELHVTLMTSRGMVNAYFRKTKACRPNYFVSIEQSKCVDDPD